MSVINYPYVFLLDFYLKRGTYHFKTENWIFQKTLYKCFLNCGLDIVGAAGLTNILSFVIVCRGPAIVICYSCRFFTSS